MKIKKLNSAGQDQRWNTHQKKPVNKLKSGQEKNSMHCRRLHAFRNRRKKNNAKEQH